MRPTLEEIFLEPSIAGEPPTLHELSPNGAWLVFRWASRHALQDGKSAGLRLISTFDPGGSGNRGIPLEDLLPAPEGEEAEVRVATWAPEGSLLALARESDVWLYDPDARRVTWVLDGAPRAQPAAEETEPDADAPVEPEPEDATGLVSKPRALGTIRSLAFHRDWPRVRELRISDHDELFSIELDEPLPPRPLALEAAEWWSAELTAQALKLSWSDDLRTVFGSDPTPRDARPRTSGAGDQPGAADDPNAEGPGAEAAAGPTPQVLHLPAAFETVLTEMDSMRWLENTSLSPDGRFAFGLDYDRTNDPESTLVPDFLTERVSTRTTRSKWADDLPTPTQPWLWNSTTGEKSRVLTVGDDAKTAPTTVRVVGWAPQRGAGAPARLAFLVNSEDWRELELWCWTEGFAERLWFEHDPRWLGGPAHSVRWTADGSLLVVGSEVHAASTRPGRSQLFAIDPENGATWQLTEVEGEVSDFRMLADGGLIFQAHHGDPRVRSWHRIAKEKMRTDLPAVDTYALPTRGWNDVAMASRDGSTIVTLYEELMRPAEIWSASLDEGRQLTHTIPAEYEEIEWVAPVLFQTDAPDGARIHAHVFLPDGIELEAAAQPRPTIVFVHGAGYLQNVTNSMTRYPLNLLFHSRLARLGYVVVDVDYRGSEGYGRDFRTDVQYHLGGKDLNDIHTVLDALVARGVVDPDHVGLYGGSYGGFLTLMALFTAPERWSAGAALRSVTDWRTYNPSYTQPRLGRPSTHPEAYERSSPIDHAEHLEDPLLILHGMMDRNVFAQDSIRLIEKLIDLGLDFDAMLYPSQGHAFDEGPHWLDEYRRIERHLLRNLQELQEPVEEVLRMPGRRHPLR